MQSRDSNSPQESRPWSRMACALLFIITGIWHFVQPRPFIAIVPAMLPFPAAIVYVTGAWEILGGIGLLTRRYRKWAAIALVALLVAVFPANINMAVNHITLGLPEPVLWLRLPLQFVLIFWVLAASRDTGGSQ
ncbi:MAG TPA: DoxX family protein [Candidatus Obscuribacterales bacterium]